MIDTHSHIYGPEFDEDRDFVVARAKEANVTKSILANVDTTTIDQMYRCHEEYPDFTVMAMGLHPTSVNNNYKEDLKTIENQLNEKKFVAIGEIGLDLYWDRTFEKEQITVLEQQIDWALSLDLPMILHIRKAYAETFKVLDRFKGKDFHGVFHCFGGGIEEAKKAVSMGFALGIGGVVTYKNSNLGEIISPIGIDHIILETDAPYLSPVPNRGKRNEPANLLYVKERLASIFQRKSEIIDEITTENAKKIFKNC